MNEWQFIRNELAKSKVYLPRNPRDKAGCLETALLNAYARPKQVKLGMEEDDRALAEFYLSLLNDFAQAKIKPPQGLINSVSEDLLDTKYEIVFKNGKYVIRGGQVNLSLRRSLGRINLSTEGKWIPYTSRKGNQAWKLMSGDKVVRRHYGPHPPGNARERLSQRKGVDQATMERKLQKHVREDLITADKGNARRAMAALIRHHGEHALARMDEIRGELLSAMDGIEQSNLHPSRKEFLKGRLEKRLAQFAYAVKEEGMGASAAQRRNAAQVDAMELEGKGQSSATEAGVKEGKKIDVLGLTPENIEPVWEQLKDEIINHDPSLSPSLAGSIAAARIFNDASKSAKEYIDMTDAKVANGENITDEEDDKYISAQDLRKNLYDPLVKLSGYRPYGELDNHPLAQKPINEPLSDNLKQQQRRRQELEQKAGEASQRIEQERAAKAAKNAAFEERERKERQEFKRQDKVREWFNRSGALVGIGRNDSIESINAKKKSAVQSALASGKPVPPEVLADYPDLAAKYGAKEEGKGQSSATEEGAVEAKPKTDSATVEKIANKLALGENPTLAETSMPEYRAAASAVASARSKMDNRTKEIYGLMQSIVDPYGDEELVGTRKSPFSHIESLISGGKTLPNQGVHGDESGKLIPAAKGGKNYQITPAAKRRAAQIAESTGRPVVPVLVESSGGVPQGWAFVESPVDIPKGKNISNLLIGRHLDINGGADFDSIAIPKSKKANKILAFDPVYDAGMSSATMHELKQSDSGFTGTDSLGREWRDGKLVAAKEDAPTQSQPSPIEAAQKALSRMGTSGTYGEGKQYRGDAYSENLSREEEAVKALAQLPESMAKTIWMNHPQTKNFVFPQESYDKLRSSQQGVKNETGTSGGRQSEHQRPDSGGTDGGIREEQGQQLKPPRVLTDREHLTAPADTAKIPENLRPHLN